MKSLVKYLVGLAVIFSASIGHGQTRDEQIKKADDYQKSGKLQQATKIMEEAITEYPENSTTHSYLGLYLGMQAGETQNYMEAGRLIGLSYQMLDKAVSLDPQNPVALFHRGLMGVNVPEFLGKLEDGIKDLETVIKMHEQSPDKVSGDIIVSAHDLLARGYLKNKEE